MLFPEVTISVFAVLQLEQGSRQAGVIFYGRISSLKRLPWWLSGKESTCQAEDVVSNLGLEDSLEKEMATHSSILAWRIPWTEEPSGVQSTGLKKSQTQLSNQTTTSSLMSKGAKICVSSLQFRNGLQAVGDFLRVMTLSPALGFEPLCKYQLLPRVDLSWA